MTNENRIRILRHLSTKTIAMLQLAVYEQSKCKSSTDWNDLLDDINTVFVKRKFAADEVKELNHE